MVVFNVKDNVEDKTSSTIHFSEEVSNNFTGKCCNTVRATF